MAGGGQILIKTLSKHDVRRVFCVAGESYLPALDALLNFPEIDVVTCRHESGATFMAETYGALTGKPGIAFVTRGPGACNASIGVHAAKQSSTPLVMFVGLVSISARDKEAFQEFDLEQMFGSHAKWVATIDSPERVAEYVSRAMHVAVSGRPGPVVIGLPEEVLVESAGQPVIKVLSSRAVPPSLDDIQAVLETLGGAERPLIVAGGAGWSDQACDDLAAFASASHLPVAAAFRRQDVVSHNAGHYVGELGTGPNPALVESVKNADVVLYLNGRFSEITTQSYGLFNDPKQVLIHVYPDAAEFGKGALPDLCVQSHVGPFLSALSGKRLDGRKWAGWRDELREQYKQWSHIERGVSGNWNGADMTQIFGFLQDNLPDDAVITTDAGNFSGWCQRYLRYGRPGRLMAPISGGMGLSVPAAISASLEYPDRVVAGFCGDGGFMMSQSELATAVKHGATPIIILCNNSMYGTIRMHQEREYPGRVSATSLENPDFVKLAESYGAFAARVEKAEDFENAWGRALNSKTLSLIEIVQDQAQITTRSKI